jgi:hypothetical protein
VRAGGLRGDGGMKDDGVESFRRCCVLMIRLEWISESMLGHNQLRVLCPQLPLLIAQRDGGPQPWIGWRPRSGHEVKRGWGLGPVPLGARWGQSNILPLYLNLNINLSS